MNTSYRLIWSPTRQAFVVADERAKTRGKSGLRGALLLALASPLLGGLPDAYAAGPTQLCTTQAPVSVNTPGSDRVCIIDENGESLTVGANGSLVLDMESVPTVAIASSLGPLGQVFIDNAGLIESAQDIAVYAAAGSGNRLEIDQIRNRAGATIRGEANAIYVHSRYGDVQIGSIDNSGLIESAGVAINLEGGDSSLTIDSIVNRQGATIHGDHGAIWISGYESNGRIPVVVGSIENSGTLSSNGGGNYALNLYQTDLTGTLTNNKGALIDGAEGGVGIRYSNTGSILNAGTIRNAAEYYEGVSITQSTITGDFRNSGLIESAAVGVYFDDSTVTGIIANGGTITSANNTALELVQSSVTRVDNSGTLAGVAGLKVEGGSLAAINNSGHINGSLMGIYIEDDAPIYRTLPTATAAINIIGTQAAITGDVKAVNSHFNLKSGAVFSSVNAIEVNAFTIEQGATLNMGTGTSLTKDSGLGFAVANDGITVGQGGFTNHGTLALAATTEASIHGDYVQASDGQLKIGVDSDDTFAKLVVNGTADLGSNAKISVDVGNLNYRFSGNPLENVLSATHLISDGTFVVSDNSRLFDFGALKNGNNVDLTLKAASSTEQVVRALGNSPAGPAATALDQSFARNSGSELASHFVGLTSDQQVSDAVTQTMPLLTGGSMGATSNTMSGINRVVQARQDSNSGLSSGDSPLREEHLWIKPFGSWADQNERNGVAGFDANTYGLAIGADAAVSEAARMGVAFAYAHTDVDSNSRIAPQSLKVETFQLIGYASYNLQPDTEINAQLDIGQHNNEGKRQMPFANATARSDYSSYSAHAGLGLGHTLRFGEALTFVPSVRADYTWLGDPSYNEKGAGALDLKVDSRDAEELVLSLDGKLNYRIAAHTVLSANLGGGYDVINERSAITSLYAGDLSAAFTTRGVDPSPWRTRAGLGLTHELANGTEVSLRYDAESRSDFLNQGASVKARWAF